MNIRQYEYKTLFFFYAEVLQSPQPYQSCAAGMQPSALMEMLPLQLHLSVAVLRAFSGKFAAYAPISNMVWLFILNQ